MTEDPGEFLGRVADELVNVEADLIEQRDKLRRELNSVQGKLTRATAARRALTGETSLPQTEEGPGSGRRRRLRSKERQDGILAWASCHAEWFTIREMADDMETSPQRLAPSVGQLVERGELERTHTEPPQYRFVGN